MARAVGIDLGTTNSCIATLEGGEPTVIVNAEGARTTPSVVAFSKSGEILVGEVAKRQAVTNVDRTISSVKRHMGSDWTVDIDGKKWTPQEISAQILMKLKRDAEAYLGETLRGVRTFKVEAKRADKAYPMKSPEICRELGAYLLDKHHHLRVDVHNPQLEIMVEIRDHAAYVHGPKVEAAGGLPVGTSGRALNLLSGGIDSPVAAWCMARRGLALHHIHFASPPYTSLRAKLKVRDLAREIVEYTGNCTLFVVPYTKPQEYIRDHAPDVLFTVLMRRSMLRIANQVAKKLELQALITGESLAQVASQTMAALACTDQAQDLPVLRPCIGMDKIEIINISRKIGTFETSIEPYEDCCTIFTPPHPKTNPTLDEILAAEAAMPDLAALETEAAENVEKIYIRMGDDELL